MNLNQSRIRLFESENSIPRFSRIPLARSVRWWSHFEKANEITPAVSVFVTQKAYIRTVAYAGADLSNEVGGWLIGKTRRDRTTGEQFVVIETVLPARHIRHGSAYLTFTHASQVSVLGIMDNYFPDKQLIGWFHTHPGMGVFFSQMDSWLHQNYFKEIWQIGLVIEPRSSKGGFFIRQSNGDLDSQKYFGFYELLNKKRRSIVNWVNMDDKVEETLERSCKN